MNLNIRKLFLRAVKSAVQTFGGLMGAVGVGWLDMDALHVAIAAGVTAGVSVIWNAVMTWASLGEDFKQEVS